MGGKESKEGQHGFVAVFSDTPKTFIRGGGAVVSKRYILTYAAARVYDKTKTVIYVGGKNLSNCERMEFEKVILHPKYVDLLLALILH